MRVTPPKQKCHPCGGFFVCAGGWNENPPVRQQNVRGTFRGTPVRLKRNGGPEPHAAKDDWIARRARVAGVVRAFFAARTRARRVLLASHGYSLRSGGGVGHAVTSGDIARLIPSYQWTNGFKHVVHVVGRLAHAHETELLSPSPLAVAGRGKGSLIAASRARTSGIAARRPAFPLHRVHGRSRIFR